LSLVVGVIDELIKENAAKIKRGAYPIKLLQRLSHAPVILDPVKSHPG